MFYKSIIKYGLVAIIASALTTIEAKPKKDKEKPDKPRSEKKVDRDKIKQRLKAAFENRKKRRGKAKKEGHKIHHKGKAFGKLVRDDEKVKELRKEFSEAAKKMKGKFDKSKFKDATDEERTALRDKMKEAHKEMHELTKKHREEVKKRISEIKKEFANKRDKVIDGNKPGE